MAALTHKELRTHIKTLERRRDFIGQRIGTRQGTERDMAYDRAEFRALDAAVQALEEKFESLPPVEKKGQIKEHHS